MLPRFHSPTYTVNATRAEYFWRETQGPSMNAKRQRRVESRSGTRLARPSARPTLGGISRLRASQDWPARRTDGGGR